MTKEEFAEIEQLMRDTVKCKTVSHRKISIEMIIDVLREHINPGYHDVEEFYEDKK